MRKLLVLLAVTSVVCAPAALAESLEEQVHRAARVSYIHGINQEIADREIGPEGVPILLDLLQDPDFDRRDNVVAFLVYLARDADSPALMDLLEDPPADEGRPEEFRARLMVPEALGRIAARGGSLARSLLTGMQDDSAIRQMPGLRQQVDHGMRLMNGQIEDVAPWQPEPDAEPPLDPMDIDPLSYSHLLGLTFANHVDTNNKMTDAELDAALADGTYVVNYDNGSGDVACCVKLERSGNARGIGVPGDGLDVITTSQELTAVISNPTARVKVVDYIGWCGSAGSNILGCSYTPGNGMVVVRMNSAADEGKLWIHEYGHNASLQHNPSSGFIMYAYFASYNTRLTAYECSKYHFPSGAAGMPSNPFGDCHDLDNDLLVSTTDNCPNVGNPSQADADADTVGDACDNCVDVPNPDQADCDSDHVGDVCDPTTVPPPVEPIFFSDKTTLTWSPNFYTKRIYRGSVAAGAPFEENHVMVGEVSVVSSGWTTTDEPPSGDFFYFLVMAFNSCGEGP